MTSSPLHPDPLQPVLREAEAELSRRLQEACDAEARGIANESAAQIRQLEDALLAAAAAAEHTLSLRRHLQQRAPAAAPAPDRAANAGAEAPQSKGAEGALPSSPPGTVREFTDSRGRAWRAWPVTPGHSRTGRSKNFLGDFQVGWICFEGLDDAARRRLAGHPARWPELTEQELDALLQRAISVRERKPQPAESRAARAD